MVHFVFDLEFAEDRITSSGAKRVVLQFTDDCVQNAVEVLESLRSPRAAEGVEFYIHIDSMWNGYPDDTSVWHVNADLVLLFGSGENFSQQQERMVWVPTHEVIESSAGVVLKLREQMMSYDVVLLCGDPCSHWIVARAGFHAPSSVTVCCHSNVHSSDSMSRSNCTCDIKFRKAIEENSSLPAVLYVGSSNTGYLQQRLKFPEADVHWFNQANVVRFSAAENSVLVGRRFGVLSRIENADIIGIVVNSVGGDSLALSANLKRLRHLIRTAGKLCRVFVMAAVTEEKLENFQEVDVFCFIPGGSYAFSGFRYRKPIVSQIELELGLGAKKWESFIDCELDNTSSENLAAAVPEIESALLAVDKLPYEIFQSMTFQGAPSKLADGEDDMELHEGNFGLAAKYT